MRIRWLREGSGECVYEQRFHLEGDEDPEDRLRREAAELAEG